MLVHFHAEGEAHARKDFLDLVERFPPEIFCLQHFGFSLRDQFANRSNIRVLEAIVRSDGKFQLIDRFIQMFRNCIMPDFSGFFDGLGLFFKLNKNLHVIFDQFRCQPQCVLGRD